MANNDFEYSGFGDDSKIQDDIKKLYELSIKVGGDSIITYLQKMRNPNRKIDSDEGSNSDDEILDMAKLKDFNPTQKKYNLNEDKSLDATAKRGRDMFDEV